MNKNKLNAAQIRFKTEYNALDMDFPITPESVSSLITIRRWNLLDNDQLIEKILQAPPERQEELVDKLDRKGIDIELATNPSLNAAQFREHLNIAHENYAVEYGHLKDSGRVPLSKELVSDPSLTANQLHCIATTHKERLLPERLFKDGSALPEEKMIEALSHQRNDHLEYSCRLAEVGVNEARLAQDDNKALFGMFLDGKENQQALTQFNAIISEKNFQNPELRSELIHNNVKSGILNENEQPDKLTKLKNIVKSFFTLDPAIAAMDTFGNIESEKPRVSQHLIDEVNKMQFDPAGTENEPYLEDPLQQLKLHKDNVEITSLSPESLERAIMVAAVKFGVPLIVEGSEEFKEAVANAIASNEKLASIPLHGELQEVVNSKLVAPEENDLSKTYEQYNTAEKYIEQSGKAYALEYPASGEPHYIAVDNKEEILQFLKVSKDELSEEARQSYENDTLEEFATRYAPDNTYGDLPAVHDKTTLQEQLDNPRLPEGIINSNNWQVGTANWFPENNAHEVYHTGEECIENSNKNFVVAYETKSELGEIFVAVDSKQELGNYLRDVYPDVDLSDAQEYHNSYSNDSFEDFSIVASKAYGMEQTASYEMDELAQEMENDSGIER